ncbi:MAG: DNA-binding protein [Firmicutes bacterium]|nr:DNA-binding protein [Bacillota bacterium]
MAHALDLKVKGTELWVLEAGDDLQEGIARMAAERGVNRGIVVSAFGSLSTLCVANPAGPSQPPPMQVTTESGPFEILNVTGTIGSVAVPTDSLHGQVHVHVAASGKDGRVLGGSLRPGTKVFWKAQLNVLVLE